LKIFSRRWFGSKKTLGQDTPVMENTNDRLSRITKGLLTTLELCEKEIRDCHTQKVVREEALRKNVVDTKSLLQQISIFFEIIFASTFPNFSRKLQ
jgi:hypothetical protein